MVTLKYTHYQTLKEIFDPGFLFPGEYCLDGQRLISRPFIKCDSSFKEAPELRLVVNFVLKTSFDKL